MPVSPTSHRGQPVASGYYAAAVTLLAVFLGSLALLRTPVLGYRAQATLRTTGSPTADASRLATWLASDEILSGAIDRASASRSVSPALLRRNLTVTRSPSGQNPAIEITLLADKPATAAAIAGDLAQQAATNYMRHEREAAQTAQLSRLRGRVRSARSEEDRLRAGLERLRQEQLSRVIVTARIPPATSPAKPAPPPAASADHVQIANLRKQVAELQVQRTTLLGNKTEAHPEVVAVDNQLNRLEAELATLAAARVAPEPTVGPVLDSPRLENVSPSNTAAATSAAPSESPTDALIDMAARIEESAHQLSQATWDRQQAEHDLETASAVSNSRAGTWTAEPARLVGRLGGTPSPLQILAAVVLALAAGGGMLRASAIASRPPPLTTVDEVRQTLELPLVAELSLSHAAAPLKPRVNARRLVRIGTRLAEGAIAAAIVACLLSVIADRSLAGEFASDPLGAMSVVVDRLLG